MLQSRCISGHKSDFEFPRELLVTGFGKGDSIVSGLRILLLKWIWYLSSEDVYAGVTSSFMRRAGSLSLPVKR